jgi:HK97 family phage prohead protease
MQTLIDSRIDLTTPFTVKASKNLPYGQVEVVVSNSAVDRHGESIEMSGIDTKQILRNPVVLWAHDYESLPIGKVDKLWKSQGNLMARIQFATEIVPFAETVYKLIVAGVLNAVSIGGIVREYGELNGQVDYAKIAKLEMIELSVVPVGAHPDALVTSKALENVNITKDVFEEQYDEFVRSATITPKVNDLIERHIKTSEALLEALEAVKNDSGVTDEETATRIIRRKRLVLSQSRNLAQTQKAQIEAFIADLNMQLKGIHHDRTRKDD